MTLKGILFDAAGVFYNRPRSTKKYVAELLQGAQPVVRVGPGVARLHGVVLRRGKASQGVVRVGQGAEHPEDACPLVPAGAALGTDQGQNWGPYRSRSSTARLLQVLETITAQGANDLNHALRRYGMRAVRPGLLFVISDLFSPAGFKDGFGALLARGHEVGLIHVLSPDEVRPTLSGDVRLVDVETREEVEVTLDGVTINRYRERLQTWLADTAAYCGSRGIHYIPVTTNLAWQKLVMQAMRAQGVVR